MKIDNYYDYELGDWVTAETRYRAVADQPRFAGLVELVDRDPARAWPLLLELLDAVPEDVTYMVGGWLLDRFVRLHGAAYVEQLEREAAVNPRFMDAVLEMYLHEGELPSDIEARLVAAFGPRFYLEPPWETFGADEWDPEDGEQEPPPIA
ncbi:MAG: hypothetical protein JO306_16930 [Gemmatimonadetes bacterium]|nr:hypothetical protein [Gemmatimonadota bacterium]